MGNNLTFSLYAEVNLLCIILLLIMMTKAAKYGLDSSPKKHAFLASMGFTAFMNAFDILWFAGLTHAVDIPVDLMYVIGCFYFMNLALSSYSWFLFTEIVQNQKTSKSAKLIGLTSLPLFVLLALLISAPFTGWLYSFNADGDLIYGPLYYLQHIFGFGYAIVASLKVFIITMKKRTVRRDSYITMFSFAVPPVVCMILQSIFQDLPIISISPTISFLLIFTNSLKLQISLDPLTGISNRRMLIAELNNRIKHLKKDKVLYFLFMDIDSFKETNDLYGHRDGDKVLQVIADALRSACLAEDGFCARYGGDEFAVIQELQKGENVSSTISRIKSAISRRCLQENFPFNVSLSIGYAMFDPENESAQSLIEFADKHMYAKKQAKKNTVEPVSGEGENVPKPVDGEIDPLTGILNLTGFYNRINDWIAKNPDKKFRIHRYDLDHFKDINGVYGHELGDALLKDIARYMKRFDDETSFSAHLYADHFMRFCAEDALPVQDYYDNFSETFANYRLSIPITMHMGVYDLCEKGEDPYTMMYKALLALQTIKGDMNNTVAFYESGMMKQEREKLSLLKDVDSAIENDNFEIWFQPEIDYMTKRVFSAEALIRWRHPEKGFILPDTFIPLLEKSNCISKVDKYVIEKTCAYIRKWLNRNPSLPVQISVNLSRQDVLSETFMTFISDTVNKYDVPHSALHFEVTESAYMDKTDQLISGVENLRKNGFSVEIDDFGAGYSSLNTLKDMDVDKLKLDMKFLSDTSNFEKEKTIISAVIKMSHTLGLPVIAEGVETKEQAEMLMNFGCNEMQGYYFSKPVPAEEYEKLLFGETKVAHL